MARTQTQTPQKQVAVITTSQRTDAASSNSLSKNLGPRISKPRLKIQLDKKRRELLMQLKTTISKSVNQQPATDNSQPLDLAIKLSDGSRLTRRFSRSSSISTLFAFVFAQDQSPLAFTIETGYPRWTLPCESPTVENPESRGWTVDMRTALTPEAPTFEEVGITSPQTLYVTDLVF